MPGARGAITAGELAPPPNGAQASRRVRSLRQSFGSSTLPSWSVNKADEPSSRGATSAVCPVPLGSSASLTRSGAGVDENDSPKLDLTVAELLRRTLAGGGC